MDALLVLLFFGAFIGVWRFVAKLARRLHPIIRHTLGALVGFLFSLLTFEAAISGDSVIQVAMGAFLTFQMLLGLDAVSSKLIGGVIKKEAKETKAASEPTKTTHPPQAEKKQALPKRKARKFSINWPKLPDRPSRAERKRKQKVAEEIAKIRAMGSGGSPAIREKESSSRNAPVRKKRQVTEDYSKGEYLIDYVDAQGEYSRRTVSSVGKKGAYIKCYCHMRGAIRTFKISRIEAVTELRTGEVLSKGQWLARL